MKPFMAGVTTTTPTTSSTWSNLQGALPPQFVPPHHAFLQGPPQQVPGSTAFSSTGQPEHLFGQPSELQAHWTTAPSTSTPTLPPSTSSSMTPSATTPLAMPSPHGQPPLQISPQQLFSGFSTPTPPTQTFPIPTFTPTVPHFEPSPPLSQHVPHPPAVPPTPRSTLPSRTPRQTATAVKAAPKRQDKLRRAPPRSEEPPPPDPEQERLERRQKDFDKLDSQAKELTDTILKIQQQQQRLLESALLKPTSPDPIPPASTPVVYLLTTSSTDLNYGPSSSSYISTTPTTTILLRPSSPIEISPKVSFIRNRDARPRHIVADLQLVPLPDLVRHAGLPLIICSFSPKPIWDPCMTLDVLLCWHLLQHLHDIIRSGTTVMTPGAIGENLPRLLTLLHLPVTGLHAVALPQERYPTVCPTVTPTTARTMTRRSLSVLSNALMNGSRNSRMPNRTLSGLDVWQSYHRITLWSWRKPLHHLKTLFSNLSLTRCTLSWQSPTPRSLGQRCSLEPTSLLLKTSPNASLGLTFWVLVDSTLNRRIYYQSRSPRACPPRILSKEKAVDLTPAITELIGPMSRRSSRKTVYGQHLGAKTKTTSPISFLAAFFWLLVRNRWCTESGSLPKRSG